MPKSYGPTELPSVYHYTTPKLSPPTPPSFPFLSLFLIQLLSPIFACWQKVRQLDIDGMDGDMTHQTHSMKEREHDWPIWAQKEKCDMIGLELGFAW